MIDNYEANKLTDALKSLGDKTDNKTVSMPAQVVGTDEEGITWVQVIGGTEKTPLANTSVELKDGDMVNVTIGNGRAEARGNLTDPSASRTSLRRVEARANEAHQGVGAAEQASEAAQQAAAEAAEVAEAVNQHFWYDTNGAHVTTALTMTDGRTWGTLKEQTWGTITGQTWREATNATTAHVADKSYNSLWNALGMLFRFNSNVLVSITRSALTFFDGLGNGVNNIVAQFGATLARIGKASGKHIDITSSGVDVMDGNTSIANFSETSRIGNAAEQNIFISNERMDIRKGSKSCMTLVAGINEWSEYYGRIDFGNSGNYLKANVDTDYESLEINAAETLILQDARGGRIYTTDDSTSGAQNSIVLEREDGATMHVGSYICCESSNVSVLTSDGETFFTAGYGDYRAGIRDKIVSFGIGSGGDNHGVYSHWLGKWIVHADRLMEDVYLNGKRITRVDANKFFCSPNGSSGDAGFRSIAAADLPYMTIATSGVSGTAKNSSAIAANGTATIEVTIQAPTDSVLQGLARLSSSSWSLVSCGWEATNYNTVAGQVTVKTYWRNVTDTQVAANGATITVVGMFMKKQNLR